MDEVGWADLGQIEPGDTASAEEEVSGDLVAELARLSGDDNPIHTDESAARAFGFPRPVAHGMLPMTVVSRLIGTRLPGPGSLWISQETAFLAPVFVGDRIAARVTVEQVSRAAQTVILSTEVVNLTRNVPVLRGRAKVKIPMRMEKPSRRHNEPLIALVTGSSRGLGRAIALALGEAGIRVIVHYLSRKDSAVEVADRITELGSEAITVQADLREEEAVARLYDEARNAFGKVDVLVNNASPAIRRQSWHEWTWEDFLPYLDIYVRATFHLSQLAADDMKPRRFGRIVNVLSSAASQVPPPRMLPYVTMKSALAGLSRALAVELGAFGITVNMVAPSLLITEQTAELGERARQLAAAASPLKRLAELEEVARTVLYLVSEGAGFTTGVTIPVAGGEIMT
ncbi:MAG: SDR family oxidoreductase [bacterium]|nr:SDR family oxidoreductase [bacterium]